MSPADTQHAKVMAEIRSSAAGAASGLPPAAASCRRTRQARPARVLPPGTRTGQIADVALTFGLKESTLAALCRRHPKLSKLVRVTRRSGGGVRLVHIPRLEKLLTA